MNKRQSKKFRNKEKCKTYRNVKIKLILKTLDSVIPENSIKQMLEMWAKKNMGP